MDLRAQRQELFISITQLAARGASTLELMELRDMCDSMMADMILVFDQVQSHIAEQQAILNAFEKRLRRLDKKIDHANRFSRN